MKKLKRLIRVKYRRRRSPEKANLFICLAIEIFFKLSAKLKL